MTQEDPQFNYPKAVQDQIDRNKANLKPPGEAADPSNEGVQSSHEQTAVEPAATDRSSSEPDSGKPAKAEPAKREEDWEKRYKNYKASTDTTVYELRNAVAQKDQQVAQLAADMQALQDFLRKNPPQQAQKANLPDDLKKKLSELYGDDDVDAIQSLASHVAQRELSARDREIAALRQQIQYLSGQDMVRQKQIQEQASQRVLSTFAERLENLVPGWEKIDNSPEFKQWMHQPDPGSLSGKARRDLMLAAYTNGSVSDVARFYSEFSNERGQNSKGQRNDPRLNSTLPRSNQPAEPRTSPSLNNVLAPGKFQQMTSLKRQGQISDAEFRVFEEKYFEALRRGRAA